MLELLFYSVLYLSNIKSIKKVHIDIYSLNHGEESVSTDLNILTYDNEDELKSNLKDFDVADVIRTKFTDGKE